MEEWQESWNELWGRIESMSCDALSRWAAAWQCPVVCVPAHGLWPTGLLVIQLPDGSRRAYPMSSGGRADRLHSVRVTVAMWQKMTAQWQAESAAWAQVVSRAQDFTAMVVPVVAVAE